MPSPKRSNTTRMLVQVPDAVHEKADARRRHEGATWSKLVATLLERWAAGDDAASIPRPVRLPRPATPEAAEAQRLHEKWMRENELYRRACTEQIAPDGPTYKSAAELFAATAPREGRRVPLELVAAASAELHDEDDGDG